MSGRGKRLWAPRLAFDDAYQLVLDFLKNCTKHNLISRQGKAGLLHAFWMDGTWSTEGMTDASQILRFGFDRNPGADQAKQAMSRLLSVACKAHFFLAPQGLVLHEPFVFVVPDVGTPGQRRFGLIYPIELEGRQSTLVVAEWDISQDAARHPRLLPGQKFPVVLQADSFTWLSRKRWRTLKEQAQGLPWFDQGPARNRLLAQVRQHKDLGTFDLGTPLDYPKDLNDDLRACGAMWAAGIRRWFLPKGWDTEAVQEYLTALAALSPKERYQLRWWTARPYPRDEGESEDGERG